MPNSPAYAEAIKRTFRSRALRTVLIIDDQFPTYKNLLELSEDELRRFGEPEEAKALYSLFHDNHMPCDVENEAAELSIDRVRKSDLIVLDYHLTPGSQDTTQSIDIIRGLAGTKHFNTVVLYTRERDHYGIWSSLVLGLRRGWVEPTGLLDGTALKTWERLSDEEKLPQDHPADEMIIAYARGATIKEQLKHIPALRNQLIGSGFEASDVPSVVTALIHRAVRERFQGDEYVFDGQQQVVVAGFDVNGPKWVQSQNCFVVILGKQEEDGDDVHPAQADRVLRCLDEAFVAWQPNILQVLISEIQNILELDALATAQAEFRDSATQVGLSYYLLDAVKSARAPDAREHFKAPLSTLIDKLVETLRHRIGSDADLGALASTLLVEELTEQGWPLEAPRENELLAKVYKAAEKVARPSGEPPTKNDALFALNSFLSTEPFRRDHLTTGTIFRTPAGEYWVCASPACDMVPRAPAPDQHWTHAMHPLRPMVAALLKVEEGHASVLNTAPTGRHVFLRGEPNLAFSIGHGPGHQPSFEMFFVQNAARVQDDDTGRKFFRSARIALVAPDEGGEGETRLAFDEYVVVGQLRPAYATKVLQLVGQHLSRIGLDFIRMPG
jgi:hypothetical protein